MGPCIIERNQDLLLDESENTHRPQQTLGLLDGAVTSEEAHQHHQSSDGYQYVDTCRHRGGGRGHWSGMILAVLHPQPHWGAALPVQRVPVPAVHSLIYAHICSVMGLPGCPPPPHL